MKLKKKVEIKTVSDAEAMAYWEGKEEVSLDEMLIENTEQLGNLGTDTMIKMGRYLKFKSGGFSGLFVPAEEGEIIEDRLEKEELLDKSKEYMRLAYSIFTEAQLLQFRYTLKFHPDPDDLRYFKNIIPADQNKFGTEAKIYWIIEKKRYNKIEQLMKKTDNSNGLFI